MNRIFKYMLTIVFIGLVGIRGEVWGAALVAPTPGTTDSQPPVRTSAISPARFPIPGTRGQICYFPELNRIAFSYSLFPNPRYNPPGEQLSFDAMKIFHKEFSQRLERTQSLCPDIRKVQAYARLLLQDPYRHFVTKTGSLITPLDQSDEEILQDIERAAKMFLRDYTTQREPQAAPRWSPSAKVFLVGCCAGLALCIGLFLRQHPTPVVRYAHF